jgi:FtsH-binding integral membrane protein
VSYQTNQQHTEFQGIDLGPTAERASVAERSKFIERTYMHLAGAIAAFVGIEFALFSSDAAVSAVIGVLEAGRMGWLIVLGAFMVVSFIADRWARSATSKPLQYAGLGVYVVAEAVVFMPLLLIAKMVGGADIIFTAAVSTLAIFAALTGVVLYTKKDFSWMRSALAVAGIGAMVLIGLSLVMGFSLGILFTVAMIVFAGGYILYDTSNVLHHYRTDQYVSASLALFASVALLFWYVLRFIMSMSRN